MDCFHIILNGTPEEAEMSYIIRDHDRIIFEERKQALRDIVEKMNGELGVERIKLDMYDQYYNMGEVLKDDMTSVDLAEAAMKALDIEPVIEQFVVVTDGSKITFLACQRQTCLLVVRTCTVVSSTFQRR